jgi:hypothetical protein
MRSRLFDSPVVKSIGESWLSVMKRSQGCEKS